MKKFVFILGMHRSGTSMLANILAELGVYLGDSNDIVGVGPGNVFGLYENKKFHGINNNLLESFDSSWCDLNNLPRQEETRFYPPDLSDMAKEIIHKIREDAVGDYVGVKDPRTALFLNFWLKKLDDCEHKIIVIYRKPLAVANSLYKRNNIDVNKGLFLWAQYNQFLKELDYSNCLLLKYEDILQNPLEELGRITNYLNINDSDILYNKVFSTVNKDLSHFQEGIADSLPSEVLEIYDWFNITYITNKRFHGKRRFNYKLDYKEISAYKDARIKKLDNLVRRLSSAGKVKTDKIEQLERELRKISDKV